MTDRIKLSLGGNVVEYAIEPLPHEIEIDHAHCPNCGRSKLEKIAEVQQWGFWEDCTWYFRVCSKCGKPTCFKQEIPIDWEVPIHE